MKIGPSETVTGKQLDTRLRSGPDALLLDARSVAGTFLGVAVYVVANKWTVFA